MGPEAAGCTHPEQIQAPLRCSALGSPLQACRRWDLRPHPPAHRKGPDFFPRVSPQIEHGPKPAGPGLDSTSPDRISLNRGTWPGRYPSVWKNPPGTTEASPPNPRTVEASRQGRESHEPCDSPSGRKFRPFRRRSGIGASAGPLKQPRHYAIFLTSPRQNYNATTTTPSSLHHHANNTIPTMLNHYGHLHQNQMSTHTTAVH